MTDIGKRIAEARIAKGLNQSELSRALGVTPQAVQKWESGGSAPKGQRLKDVCQALGLSLEYLLYGSVTYMTRGEDGHPEYLQVHDPRTSLATRRFKEEFESSNEPLPIVAPRNEVPLISWVQAGHWAEAIDNHAVGDAETWMPCPKKVGPHAFALRVSGSSMEPKYQNGDIIYLDPDVQAQHGSNVVVRLDDVGEVTFKQLVIEGEEKFLRPLNPDWPGPKFIKINGNATICGVVVGKWSE